LWHHCELGLLHILSVAKRCIETQVHLLLVASRSAATDWSSENERLAPPPRCSVLPPMPFLCVPWFLN
jgi:hypothetical protein